MGNGVFFLVLCLIEIPLSCGYASKGLISTSCVVLVC